MDIDLGSLVTSLNWNITFEMAAATLWAKCDTSFQCLCFFTTIGTLSWCFYEFARNDDLCQVTFKKFNIDKEAIYPHISLCFEKPFSRNEYEHYGEETLDKYFEFLVGKSQDPKWLNSSYEDLTIDIGDHLLKAFVEAPHLSGTMKAIETTVTSLNSMKCFTIDLPHDLRVYEFWLSVQTSIFPISKRSFLIGMTYPHQIFSMADQYVEYRRKINNETVNSYVTKLEIKGVEILRRRNTFHDECIDSYNYDDVLMKRIMELAKCKPPYWKIKEEQTLPLCSTLASYGQIIAQSWQAILKEREFERHSQPCKQIKKLDYSLEDLQMEDIEKPTLQVLDSQGKLIQHIEEQRRSLYYMMNMQNQFIIISF